MCSLFGFNLIVSLFIYRLLAYMRSVGFSTIVYSYNFLKITKMSVIYFT